MTARDRSERPAAQRWRFTTLVATVAGASLLIGCGIAPDPSPRSIGAQRIRVATTEDVITPVYFVITGADGRPRLDSVERRVVLKGPGTNDRRVDLTQALLDIYAQGPTADEQRDGFTGGPITKFAKGETSLITATFIDPNDFLCSLDLGDGYDKLREDEKLLLLGQLMLSLADFADARTNTVDLISVFPDPIAPDTANQLSVPIQPAGAPISQRELPINRFHYLGLLYESPAPTTVTSSP